MMLNQTLVQRLDYTRLDLTDDAHTITQFCQQAHTPLGPVAALCVYPQFITIAKTVAPDIAIATVVNFPEGNLPLDACLSDIDKALQLGADEIDIVLPYQQLEQNQPTHILHFLTECRRATNGKCLKVIIESGALTNEQIKTAANLVIDAQADFIKTSTGKIAVGATPEAIDIIIDVIRARQSHIGIKVSGGVRTIDAAADYRQQVIDGLGKEWDTPQRFRIGASSLLSQLTYGLSHTQ